MHALQPLFLTLALLVASPPAAGGFARALNNYRALLTGRKQLSDLSPAERIEVIDLDQWLRSGEGLRPSETRQACMKRLVSKTPSHLELELLDLKCSQRP